MLLSHAWIRNNRWGAAAQLEHGAGPHATSAVSLEADPSCRARFAPKAFGAFMGRDVECDFTMWCKGALLEYDICTSVKRRHLECAYLELTPLLGRHRHARSCRCEQREEAKDQNAAELATSGTLCTAHGAWYLLYW